MGPNFSHYPRMFTGNLRMVKAVPYPLSTKIISCTYYVNMTMAWLGDGNIFFWDVVKLKEFLFFSTVETIGFLIWK